MGRSGNDDAPRGTAHNQSVQDEHDVAARRGDPSDQRVSRGRESEVLISDSQFYDAFYSPEMLIDEAITAPQRVAPRGALIDVVEQVDPGRSCAVQIKFDPVQDPFLSEHRLRDKPTLPMVVALEAFAEAGGAAGRQGTSSRNSRRADSRCCEILR